MVQKMVQNMVQKIIQKIGPRNGPVHTLPYAAHETLTNSFISHLAMDFDRCPISTSIMRFFPAWEKIMFPRL